MEVSSGVCDAAAGYTGNIMRYNTNDKKSNLRYIQGVSKKPKRAESASFL